MPFRTGHEACTVRINPDGAVTVLSGVTSQGQGLETTMAQVVADALGVTYDDVEVRFGDTDESLWGFGAFSSRQGVIGGGAAHPPAGGPRQGARAGRRAQRGARRDLDLRGGEVYVAGSESRSVSLAEVARVAYLRVGPLPEGFEPGLDATRFYDPIRGAFAAGVQLGALEFDPATGEIGILSWVCVEDAGRVIHPQIVDGQIAGSIAQGIGGAMYEHLVYDDDGNLTTGTLLDYLMPTSARDPRADDRPRQHPGRQPPRRPRRRRGRHARPERRARRRGGRCARGRDRRPAGDPGVGVDAPAGGDAVIRDDRRRAPAPAFRRPWTTAPGRTR